MNKQNPNASEINEATISSGSAKVETEDKSLSISPHSPVSQKKEANTAWIVIGFVFALLGGWGGVAIGVNYAILNYNKKTKQLGWTMIILGTLSQAIWRASLK